MTARFAIPATTFVLREIVQRQVNQSYGALTAPTVSVSSSSSMPTRALTRIGGDFVGWRNDGAVGYYSIGRSFFQYDLARGDSLVADSIAQFGPSGAITAGSTWNFQCWYRDPNGSCGSGFNLTNALAVVFG